MNIRKILMISYVFPHISSSNKKREYKSMNSWMLLIVFLMYISPSKRIIKVFFDHFVGMAISDFTYWLKRIKRITFMCSRFLDQESMNMQRLIEWINRILIRENPRDILTKIHPRQNFSTSLQFLSLAYATGTTSHIISP